MRTPLRSIRLDEQRWSGLKTLGMDWLKKQIDKAVAKEQRKPAAYKSEE